MPTFLRWTLVGLGGLLGAAAVGVAAALTHPDDPLVQGLGFGLTTLPVFLGLAYVVLVPKEELPEHPEDNVESEWIQRATSGAFLDLMTVLGLAVAAHYVLDVAAVPLVLVLLLGLGDGIVRFVVIHRREA